jgi:protein involved in polysaccharide export with SLBB domain
MTLRQLIAAAGGLTPDASEATILDLDDPVKPGETLVVRPRPF